MLGALEVVARLVGAMLVGAAAFAAMAIGYSAFLYTRVLTALDPRLSGPLRPTPEQQERYAAMQRRFAQRSLHVWKRTWPVCVVVALAGCVLIAFG